MNFQIRGGFAAAVVLAHHGQGVVVKVMIIPGAHLAQVFSLGAFTVLHLAHSQPSCISITSSRAAALPVRFQSSPASRFATR
jgi:hypothetical protein